MTPAPLLTCPECLRIRHHKCAIVDCACTCRNYGFRGVSDQAPKRRRELKPRAAARPRSKPKARIVTRSISVSDIPAEVRERTGKRMTEAQLDWARRLQAAGYPYREIGRLLGGFAGPSVFQTMQGRKDRKQGAAA